jgi:DNA-binding NarL/FixJ family response regulator
MNLELTPREQEVLSLIKRGLSNKEIARELSISKHTVVGYAKSVYNKLKQCKIKASLVNHQPL